MLTFAFCIITFFIGFAFSVWYLFSIVSTFSKVSDGTGMTYDAWCAELEQLRQQPIQQPKTTSVDLLSSLKSGAFYGNFIIEKLEELLILDKERDAELKRKQDADDLKEEEDYENNIGEFILWQEYLKKQSENKSSSEGIPREYPKEYPKEYPDNQDIPLNKNMIRDSQKSKSDILKSTL